MSLQKYVLEKSECLEILNEDTLLDSNVDMLSLIFLHPPSIPHFDFKICIISLFDIYLFCALSYVFFRKNFPNYVWFLVSNTNKSWFKGLVIYRKWVYFLYFTYILSRLKDIREKPIEEQEFLAEFTDEEGCGRYLDLHEAYTHFINLKGMEHMDYLTYLGMWSLL